MADPVAAIPPHPDTTHTVWVWLLSATMPVTPELWAADMSRRLNWLRLVTR